jgi:hypothetical protein
MVQNGKCALCQLPCTSQDARLDHNHATGAIRGVLHNGCNSLLGKVENNAARFGVKNIAAFGHGVGSYLQRHQTNITGYTHPTHKTEEEKRLLRNNRARTARAATKGKK